MRRAGIAVLIVLLLVMVVPVLAQPDCTVQRCVYLPIIEHNIVPTEVPTATPVPDPPIAAVVLQLRDVPSGFAVDDAREIDNEEAAEGYPDPKAALEAFRTQGRETSFYVAFSSLDYLFTGPVAIADQAFRFTTPEGAAAGQDYIIAEALRERPDYQGIFIGNFGDRTVAMRRIFTDQNRTWVQYYMSVRFGRYLTHVQVIGLASALQASEAEDYAVKALARLPQP